MSKISPICSVCSAYMGVVYINHEEYLKCPTCGMMKKVSKRTIKPVGVKYA